MRLDRRLYLPADWVDAAHRERWQRCGLPAETPLTTKPALVLEMLQTMVMAGTPRFCWVTCDEAFGRDTGCLDDVTALRRW
jgi:SRSO17 transposase